jgi:hypothetical protein
MRAFVDDAEEVAVGILQHDEVVLRVVLLGMALGAQLKQAIHLAPLALRIEVEMQPVPAHQPSRDHIQGYIGALTGGIAEDRPACLRGVSGDVVERLLPEG